MIDRKLWDEDWFLAHDLPTKFVWVWAGTAEYAIPGLIRGSMLAFADQLRMSLEQTEASFGRLIDEGRFEFDAPHRLLRVVDTIVGCRNPSTLRGWYYRWERLPECEVKYNHIITVRQSVTGRKWFRQGWADTFAKAEVHETAKEKGGPQLRLIGSDRDTLARSHSVETVSRQCPTPEVNDSACLDSPRTVPRLSRHQSQDQDQDHTQDRTQSRPRDDDDGLSPAERLWALQERYRAELKLTPLKPNREDYQRVLAALEESEYSEEQASFALRAYYDQCRGDITKARYFNGRTNWNAQNMQVAASLATPIPAADAASPDLTGEMLARSQEPTVGQDAIDAFRAELGLTPGRGPTEGS